MTREKRELYRQTLEGYVVVVRATGKAQFNCQTNIQGGEMPSLMSKDLAKSLEVPGKFKAVKVRVTFEEVK